MIDFFPSVVSGGQRLDECPVSSPVPSDSSVATLGTDSVSESVQQVELVDKARMAKLLKERQRLERENGLLFYKPHRKQDLFHRSADKKYRYVRTGNRFGKSYCGAAEDVAFAVGARLWYEEGDSARTLGIPQRPTKGVILVYDWDKAEEIFTCQGDGSAKGKLFKFLPKDRFAGVVKGNGGQITAIKVKSLYGGLSYICLDTVKSFLQNPMGHESSNWDWVHVDEPIPVDMWKAYARGLIDSDGKAWFLCTPLNQPWINDFFVPGRRSQLQLEGVNEFGKKAVIVGSTTDNPTLSKEAIDEFAGLLTRDEIQCRLKGIPLSMAGLVYKEFVPDEHVLVKVPNGWESYEKPPGDYTVRIAIDPHPRTPHAVLFAATAPSGDVFFFHEVFDQILLKDLAWKIRQSVQGLNWVSTVIDPSAFIPNPIDDSCMADELADHGVLCEKAPKDLRYGILAVQQALRERGTSGTRLHFSPYLAETLWEFDHYEWDATRPDKPVDKNDHMMENLYRLVLGGLDYLPVDDYSNKYVPQADAVGSLLVPLQDKLWSPPTDLAGLSVEERWLVEKGLV